LCFYVRPYADVECLALFTAFHLNGDVHEIETLRQTFPHILGLRDNVSLSSKLRNSRNSAALNQIQLLTLVPPVVVIPPAPAGGNQVEVLLQFLISFVMVPFFYIFCF